MFGGPSFDAPHRLNESGQQLTHSYIISCVLVDHSTFRSAHSDRLQEEESSFQTTDASPNHHYSKRFTHGATAKPHLIIAAFSR